MKRVGEAAECVLFADGGDVVVGREEGEEAAGAEGWGDGEEFEACIEGEGGGK